MNELFSRRVFDGPPDIVENPNEKNKSLTKYIYSYLKSYEALILSIQRLLVWEKFTQSFIFFIYIQLMFFYVKTRSEHIFGTFSSAMLFFFWLDIWKETIWPEIRLEAPSPDSEWGELNPRLLSLYEICEFLSLFIVTIKEFVNSALELRRTQHKKFTTIGCFISIIGAIIGNLISGALISYLILSFLCFWPAIWHHELMDKSYVLIEPFVDRLRYVLKIDQTQNYTSNSSVNFESETPDEDFISKFIPSVNESTASEVLSRALTDESSQSDDDIDLRSQYKSHKNVFNDSSDSDNDDKLGFVPSGSYVEQSKKDFVKHGNQLVNEIIKDVSNTAANTFGKMMQERMISGFAQARSVDDTVATNYDHKSDSSSDFEVLDVSQEE